MGRQARALVDLKAVCANYKLAKEQSPQSKAVAIVKANAYGHGAVEVAKALEAEADAFGVACIEEADQLREQGIAAPILLLEGFFEPEELDRISRLNYWTAVHSEFQIDQIAQLDASVALTVWLKMDSGMHRLGIEPSRYKAAFERLNSLIQVKKVVLMSHFACADELNSEATNTQIALFKQAAAGLDAQVSLANSPATLAWRDAHQDYLRPGLMMYGASPFTENQPQADKLLPAMTLLSEVIAVRDIAAGEAVGYGAGWVAEQPTRVGTVAMGYGDGYPRQARSGTPVVVNGQRTVIIGRVSMDMMTVDLTGIDASVGAEVELWGAQLSINEVAPFADTIPYTLMTCLTPRVKRYYSA